MYKIIIVIISISFLSCVKDPYPKFDIKLPSGFETEVYKEGYNLLTASKYVNGNIESIIELRYSDDWAFSTFSNDVYIDEMLKTDMKAELDEANEKLAELETPEEPNE